MVLKDHGEITKNTKKVTVGLKLVAAGTITTHMLDHCAVFASKMDEFQRGIELNLELILSKRILRSGRAYYYGSE